MFIQKFGFKNTNLAFITVSKKNLSLPETPAPGLFL